MDAAIAPYTFTACGITDIGLVRQNNEDVWVEIPEQRLFILADGMGGHQAGEVASREAANSLTHLLLRSLKEQKYSLKETVDLISKAITQVNSHIYKMGRTLTELKGMGTTLCLLHLHEEGVIFAHVGDSRIYRLRGGKLSLLTKDHSLLRELVDLGQIAEEQASEFHYKNIITRAIGTEPHVDPSIETDSPQDADLYLLCSDGLSDLLSRQDMENILTKGSNLSESAYDLVTTAKSRGGHDNITLVLIQLHL